jgi:2-alkenal reductase
MPTRLARLTTIWLLLLLTAWVAEPMLLPLLYGASESRTVTPRSDLSAAEKSTIALFRNAAPSVVQVIAEPLLPSQPGQVQTGSGFIWDPAGHVVTNYHVVKATRPVTVRLASGEFVEARIVGVAPNDDLAVLQLSPTHAVLRPLAIGTSADLQVGQSAFAIGNPFGLEQTLTSGIVSALHRRLPTDQQREVGDLIQTDTPINPGNSGGPLLDSAGRLIGVNTAILSESGNSAGVGFAIPVDVVNRIVPQLIRDGRVPNPGIGIVAADARAAARVGVDGLVVLRTLPGSAAEHAGLKGVDPTTGSLGDVIVAVAGAKIGSIDDFTNALSKAGVGGSLDLTIERKGVQRTVRVQVADLHSPA